MQRDLKVGLTIRYCGVVPAQFIKPLQEKKHDLNRIVCEYILGPVPYLFVGDVPEFFPFEWGLNDLVVPLWDNVGIFLELPSNPGMAVKVHVNGKNLITGNEETAWLSNEPTNYLVSTSKQQRFGYQLLPECGGVTPLLALPPLNNFAPHLGTITSRFFLPVDRRMMIEKRFESMYEQLSREGISFNSKSYPPLLQNIGMFPTAAEFVSEPLETETIHFVSPDLYVKASASIKRTSLGRLEEALNLAQKLFEEMIERLVK